MFVDSAVEGTHCNRQLRGRYELFCAAHRFAQCGDRLRVMRAALELRSVLLLQDGNAVFDDEIGGGGECRDCRERDDEPRRDPDVAERVVREEIERIKAN